MGLNSTIITDFAEQMGLNGVSKTYFAAFVSFIAVFLLLKIFKYLIVNKLKHLTKKTRTSLDDLAIRVVQNIGGFFYLIVPVYIATRFIELNSALDKGLYYVLLISVTYYAINSAIIVVDHLAKRISEKTKEKDKEADTSVVELLGNLTKGAVWGIAIVLILSNMGYNVSALLAGLGIGGIAIAFALQNVLSDIFASFSIYFDKPFKVGDFIIVGNDMGVVKKIGIKTTRIESLWGQEIVISNNELTSTRINNYKKMHKRRVQFPFGVTYDTPVAKLKKINKIVRDIFPKIKDADLDRVHFKAFGPSSLDYEVVYYVKTGDYNKYMDIQEEINLALKTEFEKEKIEFAFPTQTIYLNKQ
ncbi:mechanosensitive ion channel family protein [Candidatus Woesearchaeota archaeon]|nr:mechanosensitive ion channel family protein [Candidatus Woesearchaeota archaeon]